MTLISTIFLQISARFLCVRQNYNKFERESYFDEKTSIKQNNMLTFASWMNWQDI